MATEISIGVVRNAIMEKIPHGAIMLQLQKALQRIIFVVYLLLPLQAFSSDCLVSKFLSDLSYEEKIFLKNFFQSFLKYDDLGHVLFFDTKPACFMTIDKHCRHKSYQQKLLLKGWRCWQSHQSAIPHANFIFLEEERYLNDEIILHIFVLNKKTLLSSLYKNISLFQKELGNDFSPEHFISSVEEKGALRPLIKNDEALLGIILGFDRASSLAFKQESERIGEEGFAEWNETYTGVTATVPKKCRFFPVAFVGNPQSKEVADLLDRYSQEMARLWQMYRTCKEPLQLILNQICE